MRIYLAKPITGCSFIEVVEYYNEMQKYLKKLGYRVLHPMTGKRYLQNESTFKAEGYQNPTSTNHAIKERDKWMVLNADVVLTDLTGAKIASIGCIAELAWADLLNKHSVVIMEKDNIHRHAFVLEMADTIFETMDEAKQYLKKLIEEEI